MLYSTSEIATMANCTKRAVSKRLKIIAPADYDYRGGRPLNLYKETDVLKFYPHLRDRFFQPTEVIKVVQAKKPNPCQGKSRILPEQLNQKLIKYTFDTYLNQGDKTGLKWSCDRVISDNWYRIEPLVENRGTSNTLEKFQQYWYNKVINRSPDAYGQGVAKAENWVARWEAEHNYSKSNAQLATAQYDMLKIMEEEGVIGKGFGAGAIWVIDGTQFDAWTDVNGKKKTFNYLSIMDGVSKMPLHLSILENGETIQEVAKALWECVNIHGVPPLGIVADNGRAFRSAEIQAMVRSWYTEEAIEAMRVNPFRREMFNLKNNKQQGCIIYPLKMIPQFPFKAQIESEFKQLNRHQQKYLPISYNGTRDSKYLSHEIGSTPTLALKHALTREESWRDFISWVYGCYVHQKRPGSQWFKQIKNVHKLQPTALETWKFYGGTWMLDDGKLELTTEQKLPLPEQAYIYANFAICQQHKITAGSNSIMITEGGEKRTYLSDVFNSTTMNQQFVAVRDLYDTEKCFVFTEKALTAKDREVEKESNIILDKSGTVQYVGEGISNLVDSLAKARPVRQMTAKARKDFRKSLDEYNTEMIGSKYEPKNQPYAADAQSIEYAEYKVLESSKPPQSSPSAEVVMNTLPESPQSPLPGRDYSEKKKLTDLSDFYNKF